MRQFTDRDGCAWEAFAREEDGTDYKGRFHMVVRPAGQGAPEYALEDIRWNNQRTADRTLETMSVVELRRRLRAALGRGPAAAV